MSSADRKRKILDHLNKSVEKSDFLTPKATKIASLDSPGLATEAPKPSPEPPPPPVVETPALSSGDRKRRVMTHVNQSSGNFGDFSLTSVAGKQKVLDHIRKSLA